MDGAEPIRNVVQEKTSKLQIYDIQEIFHMLVKHINGHLISQAWYAMVHKRHCGHLEFVSTIDNGCLIQVLHKMQ